MLILGQILCVFFVLLRVGCLSFLLRPVWGVAVLMLAGRVGRDVVGLVGIRFVWGRAVVNGVPSGELAVVVLG